jgi:hypothetical protein
VVVSKLQENGALEATHASVHVPLPAGAVW